jgi:hypothetical protein
VRLGSVPRRVCRRVSTYPGEVEVALKELNQGKVRNPFPIGDDDTFEHLPSLQSGRVEELIEQARLANPWLPRHGHHLPLPTPRFLQGEV